jgi:hypothetical protein
MNQRSDTDRLLRHWMSDGPSTMPDRVVDVVADRIGRQPQRARRLQGRPFMNTYVKLAAGMAAVAVLAVVGYKAMPSQPSPGGRPSPSVTAEPSLTTSPSAQVLPEGTLSGGRYLFGPFGNSGLTIAADVSAGWNGHPNTLVTGPGDDDPVDIAVAFLEANSLHSDPCHWDRRGDGQRGQPGDVSVGPPAIDLVNALRASTAYTTTMEPTDLRIDGYQPAVLQLQIPDAVNLEECDGGLVGGSHYYQVFSGPGAHALFQGDGTVLDLLIFDVDGTRVIAMIRYSDDTPELDAARGILESVDFRP